MALSELPPRGCHTREDWSQLPHFWELTVSSSAAILGMLSVHQLCPHPSALTPSGKQNTNSPCISLTPARSSVLPLPLSWQLCKILSCSFLLSKKVWIHLLIFQKGHPSKDDLAVVHISTSHTSVLWQGSTVFISRTKQAPWASLMTF